MKILVIDDERFVCELLYEILTVQGHEVVTALNGEIGLEKFASFAPQVILLDIRMPGISGLDVLRRIRAIDSRVGVVVISAFGDKETVEESLRLGANTYIEKPMRFDQLATVLSPWAGEGGEAPLP